MSPFYFLLDSKLPIIYYTAEFLVKTRHLSLPNAISWLIKAGKNILNINNHCPHYYLFGLSVLRQILSLV